MNQLIYPISNRVSKDTLSFIHKKTKSIAQILPSFVANACTSICVIFIGSQHPTKEWLKHKAKPLVVRCEKIQKLQNG
jgi:hypothetical protein